MLETIFVCSLVNAILTAVLFIKAFTDDAAREGRAAAAAFEIKRLKDELTKEKRRRIQAENDAAFYESKLFPPELNSIPEYPNTRNHF